MFWSILLFSIPPVTSAFKIPELCLQKAVGTVAAAPEYLIKKNNQIDQTNLAKETQKETHLLSNWSKMKELRILLI